MKINTWKIFLETALVVWCAAGELTLDNLSDPVKIPGSSINCHVTLFA